MSEDETTERILASELLARLLREAWEAGAQFENWRWQPDEVERPPSFDEWARSVVKFR